MCNEEYLAEIIQEKEKEIKELKIYAEKAKAIKWAIETKQYHDDFEFNMLDIDFVVNLYRNKGVDIDV